MIANGEPPIDTAEARAAQGSLDERYELLERIGQGGYALVYRARQRSTGQPVAIKLLRRQPHADPGEEREAIARFHQEMALLAQVRHAHVVRLLDSGDVGDGRLFIVFELIEGVTLAELLEKEGPLAPEEARRLLLQVLDALVAVHQRGLVHRDVKPENIMVSATGARRYATLLDFGIATLASGSRAAGPDVPETSGAIVGTPAWLAPEQLQGHPPDPKTDLFSWGLVFVKALTGKALFGGLRLQQIAGQLTSARQLALPDPLPGTPLGDLLQRVLDKDPSRRPASGLELHQQLERCPLPGVAAESPPSLEPRPAPAPELGPTGDLRRASGETGDLGLRADRRQVTVLTVAVEIHSHSEEQEDPEGEADLLADGVDRAFAVVQAQDGALLSRGPEGLVAVFGFPRAREDAARRAVQAGLDLQAHLSEMAHQSMERGRTLQARVGLHSGLVVASLDAATGSIQLAGAVPQVSGRVCALTEPGAVWVTDVVRALVEPGLATEPVGSRALGAPGRHTLFRVLGPRAEDADERARSTPLIGRERELGQLREAWERAFAGRGTAALLVGEPGIGKSRLLQELRRRQGDRGAPWHEASCAEDEQNSPLRPVVSLLRSTLEIGGKPPDEALARLEGALHEVGLPPRTSVPLLADLLGLSSSEYPSLNLSPQGQRERTLDLLVELMLGTAARRPFTLVVEDLHWADPSSLELIARLLPGLDGVPALVLLTSRPGLSPPWMESAAARIRLGRLPADEARALARLVARGRALGGPLEDEMVERAEGVPLFVEELTRVALDAPDALAPVVSKARQVAAGRVPTRLRDALVARLDRLGQAREVAQVASVIGREFTVDLLAEVAQQPGYALREPLERLIAADFVHRRGAPGLGRYGFKHALLRDAAYESLLLRERRELHHRVAEALPRADRARATPEAMAHHLAEAGEARDAIAWLLKAGEAALRRSANLEAEAFARNGLELAKGVSIADERAILSIQCYTILVPALLASRGYAAPEVGQAIASVRALGDAHPGPHNFSIDRLLWSMCTMQAHHHLALSTAERMREGLPHPSLGMEATLATGISRYYLGDVSGALASLRETIAACERFGSSASIYAFGQDPGVAAWSFLGLALWREGRPGAALDAANRAMALAERLGHAQSTAHALAVAAVLRQVRREPEAVLWLCERLLAHAERHLLPLWGAMGAILAGWARAVLGLGGPDAIAAALERYRAGGSRSSLSHWMGLQGEAHLIRGERGLALACFEEGLALAREHAEPGAEAELLRLRAWAAEGDDDAREAWLREAMAVAEAQGQVGFQLRVAVDLAGLLLARGRGAEAGALLAPLRDRLAEEGDTPDLRAADELLRRVSSAGDGRPQTPSSSG